jgi:hypothetical protein
MSGTTTVRVVLPHHLRTLASVDSEVVLTIEGQVTRRTILDALENRYPMLCGTIRDHVAGYAVTGSHLLRGKTSFDCRGNFGRLRIARRGPFSPAAH